jgi:hypothetical protein
MICKRTQYARGGPNRRKLTSTHAVGDLLEYLDNPEHRNHKEVRITGLRFWQANEFGFGTTIGEAAEAYRAKPKGRGRPWEGEIAEHVVYAPPPGIQLTPAERDRIAETILTRLCPDSPAAYAWHVGDDGRDDLHIVAGNFTRGRPPLLRISQLRQSGAANDYMMIAREIGEEAIALINRDRAQERQIPTIPEIRAAKREAAGRLSIPGLVAATIGRQRLDPELIAEILERKGWTVRTSRQNISVTPPERKKAYRFPWEVFLDLVGREKEARENTREEDRQRGPDRG